MMDLRFAICDLRLSGRRSAARREPRPPLRSGFTFAEVLFAVMIMGIGFIMIAAIFPVAIQQSQANLEDTVGVGLARSAANLLTQTRFTYAELYRGCTPPTGFNARNSDPTNPADTRRKIFPFDVGRYPLVSAGIESVKPPPVNSFGFNRSLYERLKGHLLDKADPRFAWAPVGYRLGPTMDTNRNGQFDNASDTSLYYEIYIVAMAARNRSAYDSNDVNGYTFQPKVCYFTLEERDLEPDRITFRANYDNPNAREEPAAAEGAYVIVADDQVTTAVPLSGHTYYPGEAIGRVYRLGNKVENTDAGTWELLPGKDMSITKVGASTVNENLPPRNLGVSAVGRGRPAIGLMMGRGVVRPEFPRDNSATYEGPAQDLYLLRTVVFFNPEP